MAIVQGYTKTGVDRKFASRSNMTLAYSGTGTPELTAYPDAKTGDVIERSSDRAQWRVLGNTLTSLGHVVTTVNGKTGAIKVEASDIEGLNISTAATANYVVKRTTSGNIHVPIIPANATSATSKHYVDAEVNEAKVWVGTQVQYNALSANDKKRVCIITTA